MNRLAQSALVVLLLLLISGLFLQHRRTNLLRGELAALRVQIDQLAGSRNATASSVPKQTTQQMPTTAVRSELDNLKSALASLRAELHQLASTATNPPPPRKALPELVYADSVQRDAYRFLGYQHPDSAFQSYLWAIRELNPETFLASLTPEQAAMHQSTFRDLPPGVMPGGYKNGMMYQASGYRILEETPLSDQEVRLKVFFEGANRVFTLVLKKIGPEWKFDGIKLLEP